MAIYIKGATMPKDCQYCICCKWKHNGDGILGCLAKNNYFTEMELCHEGKPGWCPLIEVPEPHGRLIDADDVKLQKELSTYKRDTFIDEAPFETADEELDDAPTVIEGSE